MVERTDLEPFMGGVRIARVTLTDKARERVGTRYGFLAKPFPNIGFETIVSRSGIEEGKIGLYVHNEEAEIWYQSCLGLIGPKFRAKGFTLHVCPEEIATLEDIGSFYEVTSQRYPHLEPAW